MPSDDTRQRLLEAAGEVFAEKGFKGATVRDIIQRAGVNLAAVNYHFRDKEGLYVEAVKTAFCGQSEEFPLPAWAPGTPPAVKLADFIHTEAHHLIDSPARPWYRPLMMQELANPSPVCRQLVIEKIGPRAAALDAILGELLPDVAHGRRNLIALSIIGQCVFHRLAQPVVKLVVGEEEYRTYDAERLGAHITAFSLAALGLAPPYGAAKEK
jgi:AcrR family transcriptional regulator